MIRVGLIDDEPLARRRLHRLLTRHSDVAVVFEADSRSSATACFNQERVDLAFLDIRLPGGDGFEVLESLPESTPIPAIVFVTAFDAFAVRAFEVDAVDYLLKPVEGERLDETMARFRSRRTQAVDPGQLRRLARQLAAGAGASEEHRSVDRLVIRKDGIQRFVEIGEIEYLSSARNYVKVTTASGERHLVRSTLSQLEAALDAGCFVRIHRSTVINARRIRHVEPWLSGDMIVVMESGTRLRLSRVFRASFYDVLGTPGQPRRRRT